MYYGLSYEKFYASYVVTFCAVLLAYLAFVSLRRTKTDVLKFVVFAFIWMYTAVALVPAEKIIIETNIVLSERKDSRASLLQVKMLSTDVYSVLDQFVKDCQSGDAEISQEATTLCRHWNRWIVEKNQLTKNKAWHEHNVGTLLVKAQM